jgi:hypothetical protein
VKNVSLGRCLAVQGCAANEFARRTSRPSRLKTQTHPSVVTVRCAILPLTLAGLIVCTIVLAGCGSGGGRNSSGGGSEPPPAPGFTLAISSDSLTVAQGANQSVQISVTPKNGFTGTVSISPGSLSGISVAPASISVTPGTPTKVTLTASANAPISKQRVEFRGTSGSLIQSVFLSITVQGLPVSDPFHFTGGELVHGFYDEGRQLLFATNIGLNELDVLSGVDGSVKARVPVPQPIGIDQMADGNTLVIGTAAQELVTVNEDTYAVTAHPFTMLGDGVFGEFFPTVVALANGNVLALAQEQGVYSDDIVNAGQSVVEWNPATETLKVISAKGSDRLARSGDRKWAVFSSDQFYLFSSDQNKILAAAPLNAVDPPDNSFGVRGYAINGDGTRIAVASAKQVSFFDRSLNLLGTAQIPGAFQVSRSTVKFSADGTKVFLQYAFPLAIEVVDVATATATGYLSGSVLPDDDNLEGLMAIDAEGRAWFNINGGVREVGLSQPLMQNSSGTNFPGANCPVLNTAVALNTSPQVQLLQSLTGLSLYVGGQPATVANSGTEVDLPPSDVVGAADLECIDLQGNTEVVEQSVSYGVEPVALSANLLPPFGNPTAYLIGFGFSAQTASVPWYLEIPPAVTLNGASASNVTVIQQPARVLQVDALAIPNGTAGQNVEVGVSGALGTGTLTAAASYYPTPAIVPASGLLQLTFDPQRNLLYALKTSEVDVMDAKSRTWNAPLKFPANFSGTVGSMAISPDASKLAVLAVSGSTPQMIVFNLSGGSATVTNYSGYSSNISGSLAVTNHNIALIAGQPGLLFDLSTLTFSTLPGSTGHVVRASADGTHLYSADLNISGGTVYSIDLATPSVQSQQFGLFFWSDLAVSPDGSQFAAVYTPPLVAGDAVGFFNSKLQYLNANAYPDYSPPDDSGVLGTCYSPGGQVLVVPLGDSIELWDSRTGKLRSRLMLPEELQALVYPENSVAPMIALNTSGDTIFALSKSGISVIPLPEPMDQMPSMQWPESRPTTPFHASLSLQGTITDRMRAMHAARQPQSPSAPLSIRHSWSH